MPVSGKYNFCVKCIACSRLFFAPIHPLLLQPSSYSSVLRNVFRWQCSNVLNRTVVLKKSMSINLKEVINKLSDLGWFITSIFSPRRSVLFIQTHHGRDVREQTDRLLMPKIFNPQDIPIQGVDFRMMLLVLAWSIIHDRHKGWSQLISISEHRASLSQAVNIQVQIVDGSKTVVVHYLSTFPLMQ